MAISDSKKTRSAQSSDPFDAASRYLLALTLLLVPLVFGTGLSRYEVAKSAVLFGPGGLAVCCWAVSFARARTPRLVRGGFAIGFGYLFVLAAFCSLLWTPVFLDGIVALTRWAILIGVIAIVATHRRGVDWVVLPLVAAGALTATLVLATRWGIAFPPDIATGMSDIAGARGSFDQAAFAGGFLVIVAPLALFRAATSTASGRFSFICLAGLMYFAVGVTGTFVVGVALASLVVAMVASMRALKGADGAIVVWAGTVVAAVMVMVGGFVVGPAPNVPTETQFEADFLHQGNLFTDFQLAGAENSVTSLPEWRHEMDRALRVMDESLVLGKGIGSWHYHGGARLDPTTDYYTSNGRTEYHIHETPPGTVPGLLLELGLAGFGLWSLFVIALLVVAVRGVMNPNAGVGGAGTGFIFAAFLTGLLLSEFTVGLFHAGQGVAIAAVCGLALCLDEQVGSGLTRSRQIKPAKSGSGRFAQFERGLLVSGPIIAVVLVGLFFSTPSFLADFQRERAQVLLNARPPRIVEATEALEAAIAHTDSDWASHYLLAAIWYFEGPADNGLELAQNAFERASALRPHDVRLLYRSVRGQLRSPRSDPMDALRAAAEARDQLQVLRALDPRNALILEELVGTLRTVGNYADAVIALEQLLELVVRPQEQAQIHMTLGSIFEDELNQPAAAAEHFSAAVELAPRGSRLEERAIERLVTVLQAPDRGAGPVDQDRGN